MSSSRFQVFLVFGVAGSVKSMPSGYSLDASSLDRNLSKNTRRYVENTNKKNSSFMIHIPKFILKKCLRPIRYSNLKQFHWLKHDDMEFELKLKGPF